MSLCGLVHNYELHQIFMLVVYCYLVYELNAICLSIIIITVVTFNYIPDKIVTSHQRRPNRTKRLASNQLEQNGGANGRCSNGDSKTFLSHQHHHVNEKKV